MIETSRTEFLAGNPKVVDTPTSSGRGQNIVRCPSCRIAVWDHYSRSRDGISFVRAGSLDNPRTLPPDIHIYTFTRQSWLTLPDGVPATPEFYDPVQVWPADIMARYRAATDG